MNSTYRLAAFLGIVFACAIMTIIIAPRPVSQDQQYHDFADKRSLSGIPNFADVASSGIFVLAGLIGLAALPRMRSGMAPKERFVPLVMFSVGSILTGAGSAFYHWNPSDKSLVFDRLGMVVAIAAFIALLMAHFDLPQGVIAFPILLIAGVSSVLVWVYLGDLRPYAAFQAFPVILVGFGSIFFPRTHTLHSALWVVTVGYVLAKICESLDQRIYDVFGFVSGHTLKHFIAGVSVCITVGWLIRREPAL